LFLSCLKLVIGYMGDSEALKADGLNNATDIVASVAILIGLKFSRKPPDSDHAYGHWKSESIASLVASLIIVAAGIQVLIDAVSSLFERDREAPEMLAGYIGLFSAVLMYGVYRYNKRLSRTINSQSIMAAAKDNLSDAWVSVGTAAGIMAAQLGLPWIDPVVALLIGMLICKTGWDIFRVVTHQLTDGFDEQKIKYYEDTINKIPEVKGVKSIKGRNYGNNIVVDIVIVVQSTLNIEEAHAIATKVENTLIEQHDIFDVHVHVEPD
jgi:cation diffusion facilitator family transporter